jgi:serine/threonine-protein kinase
VASPRSGPAPPLVVGRYALYGEIASGGMATVYYGRLIGPVGFSRTVAIKRLHAHFAKDPEFAVMFLDEARLAARIRHPNVVPTLDVVALEGELLLVMDYVQGDSLAQCLRAASAARQPIPLEVVSAIACAVLHGLHAAHEATNEQGEPLAMVQRDVSPQNVLVGADGVPRVLDFGVAKAAGRIQTTRDGQLKGKLAYMAPEQLRSDGAVDRRTDVYAAGVVLWETLTRQRLFTGENEGMVIRNVLERRVEAPSTVTPGLSADLDTITLRAVERDPAQRFASAREMALTLEAAVAVASATRVAEWLDGLVGDRMALRARVVASIESHSGNVSVPPEPPDEQPTRVMPSAYPAAVGASLSQVSSVSMATTRVEPPPPRGRRGWWAISLAGIVVCAALVVLIARVGVRDHAASAVAASVDPSAALPVVPSVTVASAPDPSASPAPATPSSSAAPASTPARPAAHGPAASPSPKPCTIKSYIDESGIKHYARQCK